MPGPLGVAVSAGGTPYVYSNSNFEGGTGAAASFGDKNSGALAISPGGTLYTTECWQGKVRAITPAGVVSTYVSAGIINCPVGIAIDALGNIYVGGQNNLKVWRCNSPNSCVAALSGTFIYPFGVAAAGDGSAVYSAEDYKRIRHLNTNTVLAGGSAEGYADGEGANALFRLSNSNVWTLAAACSSLTA